MSSRICLAPVTAVTCNDQFEIIEDAAIHIEDGTITYVGTRASAPAFEADETRGGSQFVALPGLVNAHTHAAMTLLRGYADDMALEPWLQDKIWPFEKNLTSEDVYRGTMLAIAEMIQGGTTTFADMYFFYEEGARAVLESGMRCCPGAVLLGFLPELERRIAQGYAFVRDYNGAGDGRITPFFAPHSLYTCNDDHWRTMIGMARELNVPIHTHASETRREVSDVQAEWTTTPIQTLDRIGALDGPLLAAHCVHLDERDHEIMASRRDAQGRSNLRVAHNPTSNMKLGSGFSPVPQLLNESVTVALGPDGTASNNRLDMWEEMRMAALIHKGNTQSAIVVSAREALLMATREGARALNLHNVGTLEAGMKADVVLVDFDKPHLLPRHNVVSHLVYAAKSSDVDTVIVDGKVLLRGGDFTGLDVARIGAQATEAAQRLVKAEAADRLKA